MNRAGSNDSLASSSSSSSSVRGPAPIYQALDSILSCGCTVSDKFRAALAHYIETGRTLFRDYSAKVTYAAALASCTCLVLVGEFMSEAVSPMCQKWLPRTVEMLRKELDIFQQPVEIAGSSGLGLLFGLARFSFAPMIVGSLASSVFGIVTGSIMLTSSAMRVPSSVIGFLLRGSFGLIHLSMF